MNAILSTATHTYEPPVGPEAARPDHSILIISFNTCAMTRRCLGEITAEAAAHRAEIIVVDNASSDGSTEMIRGEFPAVRLFESQVNLGFGNANNLALEHACGRFFVLLNTDAFMSPGALARAVEHMERTPQCGLGGGLLVGTDEEEQPSARCFHSVWSDALVMTGLAARFPRSRFFGHADRTWADSSAASKVDWVPGAFSIVRPEALQKIGMFDQRFFLYYEEVDLCLRMKRGGYEVWYWPDVVVTHIGGESSRQLTTLTFSGTSSQVVLWRMRSTLMYYRKHHGWLGAQLIHRMEQVLYGAAVLRNTVSRTPARAARKQHFLVLLRLLRQAWQDTAGGCASPAQPW